MICPLLHLKGWNLDSFFLCLLYYTFICSPWNIHTPVSLLVHHWCMLFDQWLTQYILSYMGFVGSPRWMRWCVIMNKQEKRSFFIFLVIWNAMEFLYDVFHMVPRGNLVSWQYSSILFDESRCHHQKESYEEWWANPETISAKMKICSSLFLCLSLEK